MLKETLLFLTLVTLGLTNEARKHRIEDPFAAFDKHLSHSLAYHYLWPWSQLIKAAAALDVEDSLEEPKIISTPEKYEVNLSVRRFKPDELKVTVKNRYIIIEGKHKEANEQAHFMANHFVQRFVLPAGTVNDEVVAVLNEKGILSVSAPRHELPPPPPERVVPIEVIKPVKPVEKPVEQPEEQPAETSVVLDTTSKEEAPKETTPKEIEKETIQTSSETPLEQLELTEATTHIGKIRKKELKTTTKTTKDNEVGKGVENNGLDYALIDSE